MQMHPGPAGVVVLVMTDMLRTQGRAGCQLCVRQRGVAASCVLVTRAVVCCSQQQLLAVTCQPAALHSSYPLLPPPLLLLPPLLVLQVVTFENTDTWLRVLAAEKAGLIKVDLDFKTQQVGV